MKALCGNEQESPCFGYDMLFLSYKPLINYTTAQYHHKISLATVQ